MATRGISSKEECSWNIVMVGKVCKKQQSSCTYSQLDHQLQKSGNWHYNLMSIARLFHVNNEPKGRVPCIFIHFTICNHVYWTVRTKRGRIIGIVRYSTLQKPTLNLIPNYCNRKFAFNLQCINFISLFVIVLYFLWHSLCNMI